MGKLTDLWNKNKFSIYDSEEKTVLKLIQKFIDYIPSISSEIDNMDLKFKDKTNLRGNHLGQWQGLDRPTLSEEGMRATVEKLNGIVDATKSNKFHFISKENTGDCTVIQLSSGQNILVDTGANSDIVKVLDYIRHLNITFDYVIITHYHSDHGGAIENLQEFFTKDTIFYLAQKVDTTKVTESIALVEQQVLSVISSLNATIVYPTENQIITLDNGSIIEFLNTLHNQYYIASEFDYNNCSMCFFFKSGNNEIFFSGDVGYAAQEYLRTRVRKVDIYKAHHHASDDFLNNRYMFAINPSLVIAMDSSTIYAHLLTTSSLQKWLQANNIPLYATSRNGDIILYFNEVGYYFENKYAPYVNEMKISRFADDVYMKKFLYNDFTDILKYDHTTLLKDIILAMANGTQIQTTITKSHASCPSFISSYGAYVEIYKEQEYSRILITDRDPNNNSLWIGKFYKDDTDITFIKYRSNAKSKYRTSGTNYPVNVETKGTVITDIINNDNIVLENGDIKILKAGNYQLSFSLTSNCQYANSEVRANIYRNGTLLTSISAIASINGFTYASNLNAYYMGKNDLLTIKFIPYTSGASEINVSSSILLEEI